MALIPFFLFPLGYFAVCARMLFKKQWQPVIYSFSVAGLASAMYTWSIFQSTSSTAAIGLIFVPIYASLCGSFMLGFSKAREKAHEDISKKDKLKFRIVSISCLLGAVILLGYGGYAGIDQRNRKLAKEKSTKEIQQHTAWIREGSNRYKGNANWLNEEVRKRLNDESFLIAAAQTEFLDSTTLASMTSTENIFLLAAIASNKNTQASTLNTLFTKGGKYNQLDVAFANNRNTSGAMIEIIFKRSYFTAQNLAVNPNTPKTTMLLIAQQMDMNVLDTVITSSNADCNILKQVAKTMSDPNLKDYSNERAQVEARLAQQTQRLCANQTN